MKLAIKKSAFFIRDVEHQFIWYAQKADWDIAERFLDAIDATLQLLAIHPALGRLRHFQHRRLKNIRSFRLSTPYQCHLIFYRCDSQTLYAERIVHGARDLPRQLIVPSYK